MSQMPPTGTSSEGPVYQPNPAAPVVSPGSDHAGTSAVRDPAGPGLVAPNSSMSPGRGEPMVAGAPMSVQGKIGAGWINGFFLVGAIVAVVVLILLVIIIIKII